jgi:hypothetical protein
MDDVHLAFAIIVTATLLVLATVIIYYHGRDMLRALLYLILIPYVIITDLLPEFIRRLPYLILLLAMITAVVFVAAGILGLLVFGLKQLF